MKLYDSRRAPNPRRVRWFMAEKGVADIEVIQIDVFKGEHRTPEYLAKVGMPVIPALELDDGVVITESVAICRYLESVYPEPNLFGRDPEEIAVIEMWTRRAEMLLATPLMMAVRHGHPALAALETQAPEVAANGRSSAERAIKLFDRRLGESEFIAGARVTIADILAFTGLDFARMVQFQPPETATHFRRWADSMRQRPAATAGT
jgi:glutathione S-transferase